MKHRTRDLKRANVVLVSLLTIGLSPLITVAKADGSYTIVDLGLVSGGTFTQGDYINASGQVAGYGDTSTNNIYNAFRTTPTGVIDAGADLGVSGQGSSVGGINSFGQVAGNVGQNGTMHAFRTTATGNIATATDLGFFPGGNYSTAGGINDSGQVTGYGLLPTTYPHAFRTTATGTLATAADLGVLPGGLTSYGTGINASGQVAGYGTIGGGAIVHAFRTTANGNVSDVGADLGVFPQGAFISGTFSYAYGINDSGEVTGYGDYYSGDVNTGVNEAYRTTPTGGLGDATMLGCLPGGDVSRGYGINASGQVTGTSDFDVADLGQNVLHAFVYTDGVGMQDLNSLISSTDHALWDLTYGYGINDNGQITGIGEIGGQTYAFRMTPDSLPQATPEPGVLGLFSALGLAGLGFVRRRSRRK